MRAVATAFSVVAIAVMGEVSETELMSFATTEVMGLRLKPGSTSGSEAPGSDSDEVDSDPESDFDPESFSTSEVLGLRLKPVILQLTQYGGTGGTANINSALGDAFNTLGVSNQPSAAEAVEQATDEDADATPIPELTQYGGHEGTINMNSALGDSFNTRSASNLS